MYPKRTSLPDLSGDWGSIFRGDMDKQFTMLKNKEIIVGVTGGIPPASGPCNALSRHGFYGVEQPVIRVIKDWMAGKPVPERISK